MRLFLTILLISALSGCGSEDPKSSGDVPREAAKFPNPKFVPAFASLPAPGSTGLLTLGPDNLDTVAAQALVVVRFAILSRGFEPQTPGRKRKLKGSLESGPFGGSAFVRGNFDGKGRGWAERVYSSYMGDGYTLDGTIAYRVSSYDKRSGAHQGRVSLLGLRVRSGDLDATVHANLNFSFLAGQARREVIGDLSVTLSDGAVVQLRGARFTTDECAAFTQCTEHEDTSPLVQFQGRLHTAASGEVQVEALQSMEFRMPGLPQIEAGRLRFTGASGGGHAELRVLSRGWGALILDSDQDGRAERFATRDLGSLGEPRAPGGQSTSPTAVAAGGFAHTGLNYAQHAYFSSDSDGDFLRAHWRVLRAPGGGHLRILNPDLPEPTLIADDAGDYLLELTVDDGSTTSSSTFVVNAESGFQPAPGPLRLMPRPQVELGEDRFVGVGAEVLLDARSLLSRYAHVEPEFAWLIQRQPAGSTPQLIDLGAGRARFTATQAGMYRVAVQGTAQDSLDVHIGATTRLYPALRMDAASFTTSVSVQAVDLDGDDLLDLVELHNDQEGRNIAVRRGRAGGFEPTVRLLGGSHSIAPVTVDLDGDGRREILAPSRDPTSGSVDLFRADGSAWTRESVAVLTGPCGVLSSTRIFMGTADFDADGRLDPYLVRDCAERIAYRPSGQGETASWLTLPVPAELGVSEGLFEWRAADLDGDGDADLIAARSGDAVNLLRPYLRAGDGSLVQGPDRTLPNERGFREGHQIRVADLDGDGRSEVVTLRDWQDAEGRLRIHRLRDGAWQTTTLQVDERYAYSLSVTPDGGNEDGQIVLYGDLGVQIVTVQDGNFRVGLPMPLVISLEAILAYHLPQVVLGDLDGDGAVDLITRSLHVSFGRP